MTVAKARQWLEMAELARWEYFTIRRAARVEDTLSARYTATFA
jgi:hypothetical protein